MTEPFPKKILVIGAGFGGINVVHGLKQSPDIEITFIDKRNYHLFQPLLYQVAMAGLSPAEIAFPTRSLFAPYKNVRVILDEVTSFDLLNNQVTCLSDAIFAYDYLVVACGANHSYFGHNEWEEHAPGLKTIEQATEIRRRVLIAFERAEFETDPEKQKKLLTFIVVGAGPTGVELAGAIGEMSRHCLSRDFRSIDPSLTRVILVEGSDRILSSFHEKLSRRAMRDLEELGVQVWTKSYVTSVDNNGVSIGEERISATTVLWAAGVQPSSVNNKLESPLAKNGKIIVENDCSISGRKNVFVIGDQASFKDKKGNELPGLAPVAIQQGKFVARTILDEINGLPRRTFRYYNKGQMATIGRKRAIVEFGPIRLGGLLAWALWMFVHIYYLIGFKNRIFVLSQWAWHYLTFQRGARLIVSKEWRMYGGK